MKLALVALVVVGVLASPFVAGFLASFILMPINAALKAIVRIFKNGVTVVNAHTEASKTAPVKPAAVEESAAEQVNEAPQEVASIVTRKIKGGCLTLWIYSDCIKRSVWLNKRKCDLAKEQEKAKAEADHARRALRKSNRAAAPTERVSTKSIKEKQVLNRKRYALPDLPLMSKEEAIKKSLVEIEDIQAKLEARQNPRTEVKATVMPELPVVTTLSSSETSVEVVPATEVKKVDAPVERVAKVVPMVSAKAKPKSEYTGYLLDARQDYNTNLKYQGFRVRLHTDMGVEEEVWGNDLERALEQSGAQLGDKVVVSFLGKRLVPIAASDTEEPVMKPKKIFEVRIA